MQPEMLHVLLVKLSLIKKGKNLMYSQMVTH